MSDTPQLIETHGKVEQTKPTMLEQVWGYNELSKYGTADASAYEQSLKEMNRPELENHARKVGVVVLENSERLRNKLVHEFKSYAASLHKPVAPAKRREEITDEVRKILAEGR